MKKKFTEDGIRQINTEYIYDFHYCKEVKVKDRISYRQYKDILAEFNRSIMTHILSGYKWKAPFRLGQFRVIENQRKLKVNDRGNIKGAVDYGASNKIKAEILSRGGLPYKETRHPDGTITNNGGEFWLVFHTKPVYYTLGHAADVLLTNSLVYLFEFTKDNKMAMQAVVKEDEEISEMIFDRRIVDVKASRIRFLKKVFPNDPRWATEIM